MADSHVPEGRDHQAEIDRRTAIAAMGGSGAVAALLAGRLAGATPPGAQGPAGEDPAAALAARRGHVPPDAAERALERAAAKLLKDYSAGLPLPQQLELAAVLEYVVRGGCMLIDGFNARAAYGTTMTPKARAWASTPRRRQTADLDAVESVKRLPGDIYSPIPQFEDFYPLDDLFKDLDQDLDNLVFLGSEDSGSWTVQGSRNGPVEPGQTIAVYAKPSGDGPPPSAVYFQLGDGNEPASQGTLGNGGPFRFWASLTVAANHTHLWVELDPGDEMVSFELNP